METKKQETEITIGMTVRDEHGEVRIMAIVEGYVMVRRKCCVPFVLSIRQFTNLYINK